MDPLFGWPMIAPELKLPNPAYMANLRSRWLAEYLKQSGQQRFVLGLSGGIDSAVVAHLASRAVGAERLSLVSLPYGTMLKEKPILDCSSAESLTHAQMVVDQLPGVRYRVIDIAPAVDEALISSGLLWRDGSREPDEAWKTATTNLKSRMRATILRTITNAERGLLLGTENRTENLLGYFTIGGDEESDLEPLASFYKAQVRQIAEVLGIPREILEKAPSADLYTGQTDEGQLGFTYEEADVVLYHAGAERIADEVREILLRRAEAAGHKEISALYERAEKAVDGVLAQRGRTAYKRLPKPSF